MNSQKLIGALGLAQRAGKCAAGDFAVERAAKSGKATVVILDSDVSEATRQRYRSLCERKDIYYLEAASVGQAIGKSGNKIIAIMDAGFAAMIKRAAEEQETSKQF